jgi:DNA-binding GntR family transcriptional regulator
LWTLSKYVRPSVYTHTTAAIGTFSTVTINAPLREKAYERIRSELMAAGPAAFGGRLGEHQLAAELQMSRTPVRDALRRLAVAGLVEELPGGGFVPRRPRMRDVRDQFEIRVLLETKAAELAASRPQAASELQRSGTGDETPDASGFHVAVGAASGNRVLAESIATLNERSFLLRRGGSCDAGDRGRLRAGHRAVLEAVQAGDAPAAADAMRGHLQLALDLSLAAAQELRRGEEDRA